MNQSGKPKKTDKDENKGTGRVGDISQKQFWITTIIAVIAIIAAIFAAGFGPYYADTIQKEQKKVTTAKLLYDDIDRTNWTLNHLSKAISDAPSNGLPIIEAPIFNDNSVYYSTRPDLPLLDDRIARNITIFYADMEYAELYRQQLKTKVNSQASFNFTKDVSDAYDQFRWAVSEANDLRPLILDDMEKIYNIQKNPPNRFNRY